MTFSQLIIDIQDICKLFNLGELSGYETHKHSLQVLKWQSLQLQQEIMSIFLKVR